MSIEVFLERAQRGRLQKTLRKTQSRIEALRCRVLLLLHDGNGASEVATLVGCVRASVYRTVYRYEELGEDSIFDQRARVEATKMTAPMHVRLLGYLDEVPQNYGWQRSTWTLELLALQLEQDFGVLVSCSTVYRALRSEGCRRGRRRILEKIAARVASASAQDEVFYQDEADLHLNPKIGATYLKRGQQMVVLTPGKLTIQK